MAKDLTKYRIKGTSNFLPKSRTVLSCVEQFFQDVFVESHPNESWPDDLQGGMGVIVRKDVVSNPRYYFMENALTDEQGVEYVVCNQWGKDNFERFISHAAKMGYPLESNGDSMEDSEPETEEPIESDEVIKPEQVVGSPGWKLPEALAFIIRQIIIADGQILEEELNWMQRAFDEFDARDIDVREAWDEVDDQAQLYARLGYTEKLVTNTIEYISLNSDHDIKSTLLQILMQICAQDDVVSTEELRYLKSISQSFFPGQDEVMMNTFRNAGIKIEE